MEAIARSVKHGWIWLCFIIIFFFNTFLLPEGLSLVLLLSPVWLFCLYQRDRLLNTARLFIPFLCYIPLHFMVGVEAGYYFLSLTMLLLLVSFVSTFAYYINNVPIDLDLIFRDIAIFNFLLMLLSIPLLFSESLKPLVWYQVQITKDMKIIPRLKLFTSEASHYSFLLAPVTIYFYSRLLFFKTTKPWFTLIIVTVPLILSFSLGVMLGIFISGIVVFCIYFKRILATKKKRQYFIGAVCSMFALFFISWYLFPNNPLFFRLNNIFNGQDTSARGRTFEAFILAGKIAETKSIWWGVGPGQVKLLGRSIIINYYSYFDVPASIRIPNACAETIAYFGYIGFIIRMAVEVLLFFKSRVINNPYRMWIFVFVFIYQFTGSYITNMAEYALWVLAFSNIFPVFAKDKEGLS